MNNNEIPPGVHQAADTVAGWIEAKRLKAYDRVATCVLTPTACTVLGLAPCPEIHRVVRNTEKQIAEFKKEHKLD